MPRMEARGSSLQSRFAQGVHREVDLIIILESKIVSPPFYRKIRTDIENLSRRGACLCFAAG